MSGRTLHDVDKIVEYAKVNPIQSVAAQWINYDSVQR